MKGGPDLGEGGRGAVECVVVRWTEHEDASLSKEGVAKSIAALAAGVRGPIEFDGKFCAHAEEVGEVGTDRVLPAELEAIDLASSQALPERRFGASRIVAVMTSENDLTTQSTFHQL